MSEENKKTISDESFERTGIYTVSLPIKIVLKEVDMLTDLVNRTEGHNIDIVENNNN